MIYQLPTGKIIHITLEQYLELTDDDIQYLCNANNNFGEYPKSNWEGSIIKNPSTTYEPHDKNIDYTPEDEDRSHGDNLPEIETELDIEDLSEDLID